MRYNGVLFIINFKFGMPKKEVTQFTKSHINNISKGITEQQIEKNDCIVSICFICDILFIMF